MNDVIREWADKAEADFLTARREIEVSDRPNYDAVCFHAQQCVEKLIKAVLILHGQLPPRTHDLTRLSGLLSAAVATWSWPITDLRLLDRAAVDFRYPGESADLPEARQSLAIAAAMREALIREL